MDTSSSSKSSDSPDDLSDESPLPMDRSLVLSESVDSRQSWFSRLSHRLFTPRGSLRDDLLESLSKEDLSGDVFSPSERMMLQNILRLTERRVIDIMIPRSEINSVDNSITIGDLLQVFEDTGNTRLPVYHETLDDPKGMVLVKDLLLHMVMRSGGDKKGKKKVDLDLSQIDLSQPLSDLNLIRPIIFVPPSMLAADLMSRMQIARTQMALVIDEHGGTDGLVSFEDIVEEVVGEISDEHDKDEKSLIQSLEPNIWSVDAKADLIRIRAAIGTHFNPTEISDEVDTIGGLVSELAGHIPVRGEIVRGLEGYEFRIISADSRRVRRIHIVQTQTRPSRRQKTKSVE